MALLEIGAALLLAIVVVAALCRSGATATVSPITSGGAARAEEIAELAVEGRAEA